MSGIAIGPAGLENQDFVVEINGSPQSSVRELAARALRVSGQELRAWAGVKTSKVGDAIESRPVTAVAAALGVGMIIGLLRHR